MSQLLAISHSSDKLQQAADLLTQVSHLLREVGQPLIIPSDQSYFWTDEWQAGEREVDEALKQGEYETFDRVEDLIAALQRPVV